MTRRLAFWLLALAGVAVGHVVGYAIAHPSDWSSHLALGAHAYLPGLAALVLPLGIASAVVQGVRIARVGDLGSIMSVRSLAAAQIVLFSLQEVGERLAHGVAPEDLGASLVAERGVAIGLFAQVGIAALLTLAVRATARAVRAVSARAPRITTVSLAPRSCAVRPAPVASSGLRSVCVRGPPSFVR